MFVINAPTDVYLENQMQPTISFRAEMQSYYSLNLHLGTRNAKNLIRRVILIFKCWEHFLGATNTLP